MRGEVLEWGSIVFLGAKTSIAKSALLQSRYNRFIEQRAVTVEKYVCIMDSVYVYMYFKLQAKKASRS